MTSHSGFVTSLPDLAVIEARGDDAVSFLQGQLTNDIATLDGRAACFAGYCSAKGRLLATMVVWRGSLTDETVVYLLLKADLADALIKRLSMYVLRAKVTLRRADLNVHGVLADSEHQEFAVLGAPWQIKQDAEQTVIRAPGSNGQHRYWRLSHAAPSPEPRQASMWHCHDIAAGLPWVQLATQDMFIPQTLNLDLIEGVSFTKGCYPGQEVVARSHYRGTVKRRMARGIIAEPSGLDETSLAGTDTFNAADRPDTPSGRIVNASTDMQGCMHVLMEVQLADLDSADWRVGSGEGPSIQMQALPYSIEAS